MLLHRNISSHISGSKQSHILNKQQYTKFKDHLRIFLLLKKPVLSMKYIFLNVLYGMMALAICVFVDLSIDVLEYPEITSPEQGLHKIKYKMYKNIFMLLLDNL